MKVLITGAAGFIGSKLAEWLIKNEPDVEIVGIDNLSGGYLSNIPKGMTFHNMDLETDDISYVFKKHKFDLVYHLAAYAAEGLSPFMRGFNYRNNLIASMNIVNNCINYGVKRLVYTSSMSVYGAGSPPFDENDIRNPIDPYGIAKMATERDIEVASEQHGLDYCIIRPHNVYGDHQNIWDKYRNVLGIWMYKIKNNKPMIVFGDGEQQRAFSYIGDILEPLWKAGNLKEANHQIINLGGTKEVSIIEAAQTLAKITGCNEIEHLEKRHEVKDAWSTYQKSIDILGYEHKTDLEEGLTLMWEWAKDQPDWPQYIWPSFEVEKGIYSYWKN